MNSHTRGMKISKRLQIIPLLLLAAVVPFIVRLKYVPVEPAIRRFWTGEASNPDFFSYYKSAAITILASISFIVSIPRIARGMAMRKFVLLFLPALSYGLLSIISTLFSKYISVSICGFPDRYEGLPLLLSYMAVFVSSAILVNDPGKAGIIIGAVFASAAVMCILGIFQYFDMDIFRSDIGRKLILPLKNRNIAQYLHFNFGSDTRFGTSAYGTLYNRNNFGLYTSMLLPCASVFFITAANLKKRIIFSVLCGLLFAGLVGSNSRSAFLGLAVSVPVIALLLRDRLKRCIKQIMILLACFAVIFLAMDAYGGGIAGERLLSSLKGHEPGLSGLSDDKIRDFKIINGELCIICKDITLNVKMKGRNIVFFDEEGKELHLKHSGKEGRYSPDDGRYSDFILVMGDGNLQVQKGNSMLNFITDGSGFIFADRDGRPAIITKAESWGFKGYERFASSRGYIWSRTIPLLCDTLLIGHGPDTFAAYFPQNDYMGKLNHMYDAYIIVDKPHNMYLQTVINTGMVSLASLLALFASFFTLAAIINGKIRKMQGQGQGQGPCNNDAFVRPALAGICAAVAAYLAAGLFVDSTVSVAPVFWVLLGTGAGICLNVKDIVNQTEGISHPFQ